jgi:F-type H+-transporting ATPase subunit b
VEQAQGIAKRIEEEARARAESEVEQMRARAVADIQLERDAAIASLRREFADITIAAAEKVINQSLDRSAHQRLIEEVLTTSSLGDGRRQ